MNQIGWTIQANFYLIKEISDLVIVVLREGVLLQEAGKFIKSDEIVLGMEGNIDGMGWASVLLGCCWVVFDELVEFYDEVWVGEGEVGGCVVLSEGVWDDEIE